MNPSDLTGRDLNIAIDAALHPDASIKMVLRYADLPNLIPDLFAEIRKRTDAYVEMVFYDHFVASTFGSHMHRKDASATGSTPSEALARLLLMVSATRSTS